MKISRILLASVCFFAFRNSLHAQWSGTPNETITSGKVGIGTTNPNEPLSLETTESIMASFKHNGIGNSWLRIGTNNGYANIGVGATTRHPYIWSNTDNFFIGSDGNPTIFVNGMGNGNVGIGTTNTGTFKLAVEGNIGARGIKVTLANPFPDYVFAANYKLRPLANLQSYIDKNKHLPGIPSAEEVKKDGGIELGQMNVKLLEKVEELTLYILELNKKLEQQQKEINQLKRLDPK